MESQLSEGERLQALLLGSQTWVHRRVDVLHLEAQGRTRRKVSVDFTLQSNLSIPRGKDRVLIPLALLLKDTLRNLDVRDANGTPLCVVRSDENSHLAYNLLVDLAPARMKDNTNFDEMAKIHLSALVHATDKTRELAIINFSRWLENDYRGTQLDSVKEKRKWEFFVNFAKRLASNFIFMVEIPIDMVGRRSIVKYAHDTSLKTLSGESYKSTFSYMIADFGFAKSQHVEVEVPPGLLIKSVSMVERDVNNKHLVRLDRDTPNQKRSVGHVALNPSDRLHTGTLIVEVIPAPEGIYTFTKASLVAVTGAMSLAIFIKKSPMQIVVEGAEIPSPSASILLIGPALLLSWFARTPEHSLTVSLLKPLRTSLLLCSLTLLAMAVAAAIPVEKTVWDLLWVLASASNIVAIVWFIKYRWWDHDEPPATATAPTKQPRTFGASRSAPKTESARLGGSS